ncbi:hypothetical protein K402DRAFT_269534 [Aulographum hederae CBS 113979]|uniref:Uncharacterized protein n=1 Tax=Aulographum hederae CBS 113979 TaxID=1176131 RepID=A0A6G1H7U3_9PEZI|nr:hypothetical protein K402DRAFT_269534 [Aulographum hederae CBS 113979]
MSSSADTDIAAGLEDLEVGAASSSASTQDRTLQMSAQPPAFGDATQWKATEDEQIVNTALLLFLNALTIHSRSLAPIGADWTLHRRPFVLTDSSKLKAYEACVDGYLRTKKSPAAASAIIEVKPFLRSGQKGDAIRMQETAQMAAWIRSEPHVTVDVSRKNKATYTRFLVSQDKFEIYLTFATFDAQYEVYLRQSEKPGSKQKSFLRMQEYGPFNTKDSAHNGWLGSVSARLVDARNQLLKSRVVEFGRSSVLCGTQWSIHTSAGCRGRAPHNTVQCGGTWLEQARKLERDLCRWV